MFHLHGPLDPESPLFVGREEDLARIDRWLRRGDAVGAVLGGRQNGKTSILLRARERARAWQTVAFVDFQAVAGADPAACARHLAEQIAEQLGGALAVAPPLPEGAGGLQAFLRATAKAAQAPRLGLFLDELGVLPEETRRWLGSALRASFNLRLVHRELGRWTFVLAGGIELCDMAVHRNSPLRNVLDEIYLGDLSEAAMAALLTAAAAPNLPASRASELCRWTAGQPYLTQALAEEAARCASIGEGAAALLRAEAHNLPHVFHAVDREGLEPLFRRIVAEEPVPFTRLDDDVARLELIGVLRDEAGLCRPRNALYAEAARRRYGIVAPAYARGPQGQFQAGQALLVGVSAYLTRESFEDLPATPALACTGAGPGALAVEPLAPVDVFISYAPKDEAHREALEKHLTALWRQGLVTTWHEGKVAPGEAWELVISAHIDLARLVLLLVSADYLADDPYWREMERALERHRAGEARVIPILVDACDWEHAPFGKLKPLPDDRRAVTSWPNSSEAWRDVVLGIRRAVEELRRLEVPGRP